MKYYLVLVLSKYYLVPRQIELNFTVITVNLHVVRQTRQNTMPEATANTIPTLNNVSCQFCRGGQEINRQQEYIFGRNLLINFGSPDCYGLV